MAHIRQLRPDSGLGFQVKLTPSSLGSGPRKALRGGIQKSILKKNPGNMGDSRQMSTKTRKWLQERGLDTPTKGLLWTREATTSTGANMDCPGKEGLAPTAASRQG